MRIPGYPAIPKGESVFILVVAFLCLFSIGMVAFTDVVQAGPTATLKAAIAQLAQYVRRTVHP
jgi:hypothetical protein